MIELHINSLLVGGLFGLVIGVAISFFAAYLTEMEMGKNDRFSAGWDAGVKYGKKVASEEKDERGRNQKSS